MAGYFIGSGIEPANLFTRGVHTLPIVPLGVTGFKKPNWTSVSKSEVATIDYYN